MSKSTWKQVRHVLGELQAPAPTQDRDAFWQTFRARALPQPRQEDVTAPRGWLAWSVVRYGAIAATVMLVGVWLAVDAVRGPQAPIRLAVGPANHVQALQVAAEHSAVLIMQADDHSSTIVWIADMAATVPARITP
jgi:hypothetical protein